MARVVQEISAAQRFLAGLRALPNFPDLRQKQQARLEREIRKTNLPVELAARVLDELDVSLWGDALHRQFVAIVADRTVDEDPASQARAKLQDFCMLPAFLNQHWWDVLESKRSDVHKLEALCKHVTRLGLRHPTEATYGALLVLSSFASKREGWYDSEKLQLLETQKARMKKVLQHEPVSRLLLEKLPSDVAEMPTELLDAAYPDGFVAGKPSILTMDEINNLISTYPLRKTNRAAPVQQGGHLADARVLSAAMHTLANVSTAMMQQQRQQQVSADVSLPGLKILKSPQKAGGAAAMSVRGPQQPLALEDNFGTHPEAASVKPFIQPEASAPEKSMPLSPRSTIQVLKDKAEGNTREVAEESTVKPMKKERVKKSSTKKKIMRRPAAAPQVCRRPAAAQPVAPAMDPRARREALLRVIPKKVLQNYKHGCSTCRHREYCTVSCWLKRGFTFP